MKLFFAFGNTSAKRLTAHLPPDQESASILLLGCGDWRHLLFTSWCHEKAGGLVARQVHEALVCDIQPSIMARNLVLWKLIYDGADLRMAWMIFFSKVLDDACLELLRWTATSLMMIGYKDGKTSWTHWNDSHFGRLCPFTNEQGFRSVYQRWQFYTQLVPIGSVQDGQVKCHGEEEFNRPYMVEMGNVLHTAPFLMLAVDNMDEHNEYMQRYAGGDIELFGSIYAFPSESRLETMRCNPMLLTSSIDVQLFHALDPPSAFHPGLCYGPLQNTESVLPGLEYTTEPEQFQTDMLTTNAFAEFSVWCQATKVRMDRQLIKVHVHVGDVFDLLRVLTARRVIAGGDDGAERDFTRVCYIGTNGLVQVRTGVPIVFDVIDTSNLADHCGLLNMLLSCKPVLRESLSSTLFTENLSKLSADMSSLSKMLEPRLGTDIETFAVLTGLVLMDYPSTTSCHLKSARELKPGSAVDDDGFTSSHLFLRWKVIPVDERMVRVSMTDDTFVEEFYQIYCRIFAPVLKPTEYLESVISKYQKGSYTLSKIVQTSDYINSTHQTFALLLATCMHLWPSDSSLLTLADRIHSSGFQRQSQFEHELTAWWAYYNVVSPTVMKDVMDRAMSKRGVTWEDDQVLDLLEDWDPEDTHLICVTLLVSKVRFDHAVADLFNPLFELAVASNSLGIYQVFANVRLQFLRDVPPSLDWTLESLSSAAHCTTMEECTVVACSALVPICCLVGEDTTVLLTFPHSMMKQKPDLFFKLGQEMVIVETTLSDRVHVACSVMGYGTEPVSALLGHTSRPSAYEVDLRSSLSNDVIARATSTLMTKGASQLLLTARLDFMDPALLRDAAPVVRQLAAPHEVEVQVTPDHAVKVLFPVPVDVGRLRMQVSRAKGFINLLAVPLSFKTVADRFIHLYVDVHHPAPTSSSSSCAAIAAPSPRLALYGTSYVYLDTLVEFNLGTKGPDPVKNFLQRLIIMGATNEERRVKREKSPHKSAMGAWKEIMHGLVEHVSPKVGQPRRLFVLCGPDNEQEIALYINSVKEEYTIERSVLLDVAVCSVEASNRPDLMRWIQRMHRSKAVINVLVTADETKLWKRMLPGLIERTRTDWTHRPTCEYLRTSKIPLSDEFSSGEKVVCSCGLGQQLEDTPFMKELRASNSTRMAGYFARAAIPWIFSLEQYQV